MSDARRLKLPPTSLDVERNELICVLGSDSTSKERPPSTRRSLSSSSSDLTSRGEPSSKRGSVTAPWSRGQDAIACGDGSSSLS